MMYCESCGAANTGAAEQCFACQQPLVEKSTERVEPANKQPGTVTSSNNNNANLDTSPGQTALLQGRYQLLQEVGTGGFGAVYKAIDTHMSDCQVAIKEIRLQGLKPNEVIDATDTFNREVSILSELKHPNLPCIHDHFTAPEHWYLVMDFIEGQTLETYLNKTSGRLSLDEVFAIGMQLCTVLDYLHTQQPPVIFRDLKPTNIMITDYGQVYLIDFGAARYFKPGRTKDTIAFGSPGYAAPEQYGKAQTTTRSDIYSLGATLHEALTGRDPGEAPFHFASTGAAIPTELEELIMRMIEMDASKRPASATVVKNELQRISVQHTRRLYPLSGASSSRMLYQLPPVQSQPPPADWAISAPSVQQAQIQLGLPPTPMPRKRGISRRTASAVLLLGLASAAFVQNSNWLYPNNTNTGPNTQPPAQYQEPHYTLSLQKTLKGHTGGITSVAWADQKGHIASGSKDGTVKIWNIFSQEMPTFTHSVGHQAVSGVAWSPIDTRVAATTLDKTMPLVLWGNLELDSLNQMQHYQGKIANTMNALARSLDSKQIANTMNALAWSLDGKQIAMGGHDSIVRVVDVDTLTGEATSSYSGHTAPVLSLAWSDHSNYFASGSADKTVRVWAANKDTYKPVRSAKTIFSKHTGEVNAIAWASIGEQDYIISGGADKLVIVWDAFSGETVQTYPMPSAIHAIAWSSVNSSFVVGCEDGSIYLIRILSEGAMAVIADGNAAIRSLAWSPDNTAIVSGGDDQIVKIWYLQDQGTKPGQQ